MRRFSTEWTRGAVAALTAVLLVVAASVPADARRADRRPGTASPFNLRSTDTFLMNFNEWLCGIQQIGEVCTSAVGSSVGGGGFWPSGTANQYIFNSGLQIAAVIGEGGGALQGDTVATFFFNASGPGAGAPTPFWDAERGATGGNGNIFASSRPQDLANWPEDCYIDSPVFGRVKTLSELDTCVQYWDGDPTAAHFADSRPIGIAVTQHSMLWSFPANKDIMFFIYTFENVTNTPQFATFNPGVPAGGYTIDNIYAAFAMDPDVSGSEYSENFATVIPELNMAAAWQYDFEAVDFTPYAPNFDGAVGFVGVKYLQSPRNTSDTTITVRVGAETRQVAPGEELGLTFFSVFTNGGIMSDAENAAQAYRYLSGGLLPTEIQQWCPNAPPGMCYVNLQSPDDMRFYQSAGPFSLAPGESADIVVAYIAGAPVPGTYNMGTVIPVGDVTNPNRAIEATMGRGHDQAGFPSLFANALIAQAIFDADFVLPAAPPSPTVSVIPGDRQVTVVWDAGPVNALDPFAELATDPESDLFDPNFRGADFEGFRVYRKSNPAAEFTLIAQFDLANGISEQVTVLEEVETVDGSIIVIRADTATVCPPTASGCTPETGLQFAVVDRGGAFPNPQNGPGLTNGIRYYYAVTSFDINSPFSGPSSLESARVLSVQASAVPRSTAAGAVAASIGDPVLLDGNGQPLPTGGSHQLDSSTGTFEGPAPPTNGFDLSFALYDPLLVAPGTLSARIDSIVPLNGFEALRGEHQQLNPGGCLAPASTAYFLTVTTPSGSEQRRVEIPLPFGYFAGCESSFSAEVVNVAVEADQQKAAELGVDGDHFAGALTLNMSLPQMGDNSGAEAVTVHRLGAFEEVNQSRWFVGTPSPRDPNDPHDAGDLAGVTAIYNMGSQYVQNANLRWLVYLNSGVLRAADYEVTWGANGTIESVRDVTHNIEVPFSEHYRGSWGVRNEASGDGILSMADFWYTSPIAEWYCEVLGCHVPLEQQAVIQPLSSVPPAGFGDTVNQSDGEGFGLYISGELFLFETSTLPPAGTVWTLRSYQGAISVADGAWSFEPSAIRPPNVTGLTASVTIESAADFDIASANLDNVHTVPDPYYVTSKLENTSAEKRMLFVNLPPEAVVRIYTLSGVLVAALEHNDPTGGGTLEWDLRTRNNQFVASGVYFFHVETPDGKEKVGRFTVIQYAQ